MSIWDERTKWSVGSSAIARPWHPEETQLEALVRSRDGLLHRGGDGRVGWKLLEDGVVGKGLKDLFLHLRDGGRGRGDGRSDDRPDGVGLIPATRGGPVITFNRVPEPKTVKNRMHLAHVFRRLRRIPEVVRISRLKKKQ